MIEKTRAFILRELLGGADVEDQDDLLLSGLVDSMGIMRLVSFIEDESGQSVPPEDVIIDNFSSIATITGYVQRRGF